MSLKVIIVVILILFISSKILNYLVRKSEIEKKKSEKQNRLKIPMLNTLGLYSAKEFKEVVKKYLKQKKYLIIEDKGDYIIIESEENILSIVQINKFEIFSDKVIRENVYMLVSNMNNENVKKGIIISNGSIAGDTISMVRRGVSDFDISIIDGITFVRELKVIREKLLLGGKI
ncbi:restriction endonuclease [uncultured Clostridium sp.]|uniref:restriction endonuclease n=1 Tax=uncultured Clostridium sp. TaxID=59620 RepID=UPI002605A774|nr:restriction endonuclease [uncultured Clostridium sp.]